MADLSCPICLDILTEPFVTACGHTFCYTCVTAHLENKKSCPSCSAYLTTDKIFPNHLLNQISVHHAREKNKAKCSLTDQLQNAIQSDEDALKLGDVELLLSALEDKRQDLQQKEKERRLELLLHFLQNSRSNKSEKLSDLQDELSVLSKDIDQVLRRNTLPGHQSILPQFALQNGSLQHQPQILDPGSETKRPRLHLSTHGDKSQNAEHLSSEIMPGSEARGGAERDTGATCQASLEQRLGSLVARLAQDPTGTAERPLPSARVEAQPIQTDFREPNGVGLNSQHQEQPGQSPTRGDLGGRQNFQQPVGLTTAEALLSAFQSANFPELRMDRAATASAFLRVPSVTRDLPVVNPPTNEDPVQWLIRSLRDTGPSNAGSDRLDSSGQPTPSVQELPPGDPSPQPNGVVNLTASDYRRVRLNGVTDTDYTGMDSVSGNEHAASNLTHGSTDVRSNLETGSSTSPKRRTESHFDDLQKQYFKMRQKQLQSVKRRRLNGASIDTLTSDKTPFENGLSMDGRPEEAPKREFKDDPGNGWQGPSLVEGAGDSVSPLGVLDKSEMREFSRTLSLYTKNTRLEVLASISASTPRNSAAIISGVAFNLDSKMFAAAGVSKRVALYNTESVLTDAQHAPHKEVANRPQTELMTPSKLSCISWNHMHESHLLSSDYEGVITLWDTQTQQPVTEFEAHQKRIWSVDFSPSSSHILVSASDDGLVKLWSTRQSQCTGEINMRANVCSAQFNPFNEHEICAGGADHRVHIFDIRQPQRPVESFAGHAKSVSYVRYTSANSLVSASTDSTLKAWRRQDRSVVRTFTGHLNCKNFVGLAADGDFIATGSETSEAYVYYKSMSRPVAKSLFRHPAVPQGSSGSGWRSGPAFISALTWQPKSEERILLAGSSHGTLKLLKLVTRK